MEPGKLRPNMRKAEVLDWCKAIVRSGYFSPRASYVRAATSLPYRLSEHMFGDLLVAYVLGFVGAVIVASAGPTAGLESPANAVWQAAPFLAVSLAYAFVTASAYVTYHVMMVARPTVKYRRMALDFILALAQAILFGVTQLKQLFFVVGLGLLVVAFLWRQRHEFVEFSTALSELYAGEARGEGSQDGAQAQDEAPAEVRTALAKYLRPCGVEFWGEPPWWHWLLALAMVAGGTTVLSVGALQTAMDGTPAGTWAIVGVAVIVVVKGFRVVNERAEAMHYLLVKEQVEDTGIRRVLAVVDSDANKSRTEARKLSMDSRMAALLYAVAMNRGFGKD